MAKKNYNLQVTESNALEKLAHVQASSIASKNAEAAVLAGAFAGFEDRSLPPFLKAATVEPGTVIMGEFTEFGEYNDDQVHTAVITVDCLDFNVEKGELYKTGSRLAIPVSAVIARALGAEEELKEKASPDDINKKIQANGYGIGTTLVMRYTGLGKKRKGFNAPHLWDVKLRKPVSAKKK